MTTGELDRWLPDATVRVTHRREARLRGPAVVRRSSVRLRDTRALGSLVRWRIPGVAGQPHPYDKLFVLARSRRCTRPEHALLSGLCGRIWTLRRDYPRLAGPDDFLRWSAPGTAESSTPTGSSLPATDGRRSSARRVSRPSAAKAGSAYSPCAR